MRHCLKEREKHRKGGAFPHCAAAKPRWLIERRGGKVLVIWERILSWDRFTFRKLVNGDWGFDQRMYQSAPAALPPHSAVRLTRGCISESAPAALPPHSAVRLCLTVKSLKNHWRLRLPLRRSLKRKRVSGGKAEPFRTVRRQSRTG